MIKNVYKDEGAARGYSYLALSEPVVIQAESIGTVSQIADSVVDE